MGGVRNNIWKNISWTFSKFDENDKLLDRRLPMKPKHKQREEIYTKAHHNQNCLKAVIKSKMLNEPESEDTLCTEQR